MAPSGYRKSTGTSWTLTTALRISVRACRWLHTCMHAYIHIAQNTTRAYTLTHTYTRARAHTHTHTHAHTYYHAQAQAQSTTRRIHECLSLSLSPSIYPSIYPSISLSLYLSMIYTYNSHARTHTHTYTHSHTHTHTHTQAQSTTRRIHVCQRLRCETLQHACERAHAAGGHQNYPNSLI